MSDKTIAFLVDEDFHKEIKIRLAETGKTLKGYLICLIREDLQQAEKNNRVMDKEYTVEDIIEKASEIIEIADQIAKK